MVRVSPGTTKHKERPQLHSKITFKFVSLLKCGYGRARRWMNSLVLLVVLSLLLDWRALRDTRGHAFLPVTKAGRGAVEEAFLAVADSSPLVNANEVGGGAALEGIDAIGTTSTTRIDGLDRPCRRGREDDSGRRGGRLGRKRHARRQRGRGRRSDDIPGFALLCLVGCNTALGGIRESKMGGAAHRHGCSIGAREVCLTAAIGVVAIGQGSARRP